MRLEDVRIGQKVKVTIDKTQYSESDYRYLTRADGRNPEPSVEQQTLTVFDFHDVELPTPHRMITLLDDYGRKAYLAEPHEIEVIA
jgi:hypothetical protein